MYFKVLFRKCWFRLLCDQSVPFRRTRLSSQTDKYGCCPCVLVLVGCTFCCRKTTRFVINVFCKEQVNSSLIMTLTVNIGGVVWAVPVMWSETVGLRTRPVWDQKIGLGLAGLMSCCGTRSCNARRHNDLEGHSNFLSPIYSFSVLCLEHHYCGDQQWRSLT